MRRWWQQLPVEQKLRWQGRWWKLRHPQPEDIIRIVWTFLTPIRIIGFTILAIAIIGAANNLTPSPPLPASWGAISVELFGIGIIVLIIDVAYERRAIRQHKTELILQMGSPDNSVAIEAVRRLRLKGWLQDGSLKSARLQGANLAGVDLSGASLKNIVLVQANLEGAKLSYSNLEGAYLEEANLKEVDLTMANLEGAHLWGVNLEDAELQDAKLKGAHLEDTNLEGTNLWRARLPDGSKYTPDVDLTRFTKSTTFDIPDFAIPWKNLPLDSEEPTLEDRLAALEREVKLLRAAQRKNRHGAARRTNSRR